VVIGITSIVAMTSLIRGFDQSLQNSISAAMGPKTIFIQRFGVTSFASGREFLRAHQASEPLDLRRARARGAEHHAAVVDIEMGSARADSAAAHFLPGPEDTAAARVRHV
jgi:hypothetical protein